MKDKPLLYTNKYLFIISLSAIFLSIFSVLFVIETIASPYTVTDELPENGFGSGETIEVNISFFKNLFNLHTAWKLQTNTGAGWYDNNQCLTLEKTWKEENETGYWKINLILDTDHPGLLADYRFLFGCDLVVLNYVDRTAKYEYWLNYTIPGTELTYHCFFNWSDIKNIPDIIINKGFTDNKFWFSIRKNDLPNGLHYELDPIFGYNGTGSVSSPLDGVVGGTTFTMGEKDGKAINMSAYLDTNYLGCGNKVKLGIYYTNSTFLAETEEKTVTSDNYYWETFNLTTNPVLLANTNYTLVGFANSSPCDTVYLQYSNNASFTRLYDSNAYPTFPNPASWLTQSNRQACIYLSYINQEVEPTLSNFTIPNGSMYVDFCNVSLYWNVTIADDDGNTTTGNLSCSNGNYTNWTSQANHTRSLLLTGLEGCTNYTVWLNLTDGNFTINNTYWFITNCSCPGEGGGGCDCDDIEDLLDVLEAKIDTIDSNIDQMWELGDIMEVFMVVVALALLGIAVFTKDGVIGAIVGYGDMGLILYGIFNMSFAINLDTVLFIIGFLAVAVAVYQSWVGVGQHRQNI